MRALVIALALVAAPAFSQAGHSPAPAPAPAPAALPPLLPGPPEKDQWLYGSGESSASVIQTYRALTAYALAAAKHRPANSVVLAEGSSPLGAGPLSFVPCGHKPLAVIFDADETLIWNIPPTRFHTLYRGGKNDPAVWGQWEKGGAGYATAMPGAAEMLAKLRAAGIKVIVNTNRLAENAEGNAATLEAAGLGHFVHGESLFLKNDDSTGSSKDARRALVASRTCVVAMAGDQLGDFSNAFNQDDPPVPARRAAAARGPASALWGKGWFMLSNPSYGPALRGTIDDVYGKAGWLPTLPPVRNESGTIDGVMAALYGSITGPAGPRDWNRLRALFAPGSNMGAVGPRGVRTRDVEGYIAVNAPFLKDHGFYERELWRDARVYGDLAQIWSAYEGRESPDGPVIDRGINALQLGRHGDRWVILSLTWQSESPALPLPAPNAAK